ncbi:uncharacterized protein LOC113226885 [Hyposmocoma kahamanoa]|uniref:uncharacterized protein LOC113226885 n=1 Tax=Hyposmocoma kahamanoa TaxID=1477025 RepID=UPI000E6D5B3F|nr:uncharacterized protein LOC113226885 [Hyposmocoma kahamanoa]
MVRATLLCVQLIFLVGIATCMANDELSTPPPPPPPPPPPRPFECVETDDPNVVRAATEAIKVYDEQVGSEYILTRVTKAEMQVDAGRNYKLTFIGKEQIEGFIDTAKCVALVNESLTQKLTVKNVECTSSRRRA